MSADSSTTAWIERHPPENLNVPGADEGFGPVGLKGRDELLPVLLGACRAG
jgi:hypothetical protein